MAQFKVTFTTDAEPVEIRQALGNIPGNTYYKIEKEKTNEGWSQKRQLIVIWILAFIASIALVLFLEWGTRP